jgi:hypothetical protein
LREAATAAAARAPASSSHLGSSWPHGRASGLYSLCIDCAGRDSRRKWASAVCPPAETGPREYMARA